MPAEFLIHRGRTHHRRAQLHEAAYRNECVYDACLPGVVPSACRVVVMRKYGALRRVSCFKETLRPPGDHATSRAIPLPLPRRLPFKRL